MNLTRKYNDRYTPRLIYIDRMQLSINPEHAYSSTLRVNCGDMTVSYCISVTELYMYPNSFIDTVEMLCRTIENYAYKQTGRRDRVDHTSVARELQILTRQGDHFPRPQIHPIYPEIRELSLLYT